MLHTTHFAERVGRVHIPVADDIVGAGDHADHGSPGAGEAVRSPAAAPPGEPGVPGLPPLDPVGGFPPPWRLCRTSLRQGCYTLNFVPAGATVFSTRYHGTLRVERVGAGYRISGDLYTYRLLDDLVVARPPETVAVDPTRRLLTDDAADTADIPVYPRRRYRSYLKGTAARLWGIVLGSRPCPIALTFDEFLYSHPPTGFDGSFPATPARTVTFRLTATSTPELYSGAAYDGATRLGSVSIRRVSASFRRATLVVHTLSGSVAPGPAGAEDFRTIMATAGWDLTVTDGGTVTMPATISGQSPTDCWSDANLHRLMASVPGYDPAGLDRVWRTHLLAVQARVGCGRGVVFDNPGGDLNAIAREGSATFSDDGYPTDPNFGTATDRLQRQVPRAFLRSAAHEVGHAFNQIHQSFEGGNDNSIMTTSPAVAAVLAASGQTFPDDIALGFNATVRTHLRHLPDPAVRPGAMAFFGAAVSAPEPSDVGWQEELSVAVQPDRAHLRLGEPLRLAWSVTNTGGTALPVPEDLDPRALVSRISVTDPDGRVTFMRPLDQRKCAAVGITPLAPGGTTGTEGIVFYGRDGFAFTKPGRHTLEVIVLWEVGGAPVGTAGRVPVWVDYPVSARDNEVAALLLDPAVGAAVALGDADAVPGAADHIAAAARVAESHPACAMLASLGLTRG